MKYPKSFFLLAQSRQGLDDKYLHPTTPRNSTASTNFDLDEILGKTVDDVSQSAMDNFNWSAVFNTTGSAPKTTLELPSNVTLEASFFKGRNGIQFNDGCDTF